MRCAQDARRIRRRDAFSPASVAQRRTTGRETRRGQILLHCCSSRSVREIEIGQPTSERVEVILHWQCQTSAVFVSSLALYCAAAAATDAKCMQTRGQTSALRWGRFRWDTGRLEQARIREAPRAFVYNLSRHQQQQQQQRQRQRRRSAQTLGHEGVRWVLS